MYQSLLLTVGLFVGVDVPASEAANLATYTSYTKAWNAAKESARPMFVVLNPPEGRSRGAVSVSVQGLREDETLNKILDEFIVAEIDTSTSHGRQVLARFGSPTLPRIVVIDDSQKKQIYAASGTVSPSSLKSVLGKLTIKAAVTTLSLDWLPKPPSSAPASKLKSGLSY